MRTNAIRTELDDGLPEDLPEALRWRESMGRIEAVLFASATPVPRDVLARLADDEAVLDDLIAEIREELKARPYDLVAVAGGYQLRTRPRYADTIRQALGRGHSADGRQSADAPDSTTNGMRPLSPGEEQVVTAIAYLQPIGREALSAFLSRAISRDTLASLKRTGLIGTGPRLPQPGAPASYVTTKRFLEVFGLASLRDLPDAEAVQQMAAEAVADLTAARSAEDGGAEGGGDFAGLLVGFDADDDEG